MRKRILSSGIFHPVDGHCAANAGLSGTTAFTNIGSLITSRGFYAVYIRGDGDVAADTFIIRYRTSACTDASTTSSTSGIDCAATDSDIAAFAIGFGGWVTATDARMTISTRGSDCTAADGDVATVAAGGAPNACTFAACSSNLTTQNFDITTGTLIVTSDARSIAGATRAGTGGEFASALNGECRARWACLDARILFIYSLHGVNADERNLRVALTGEAGITAACPSAVGIDAQVIERHLGTFGNRNLHISAECAR